MDGSRARKITSVVDSLKSLVAMVAAIGVGESIKVLLEGTYDSPDLGALEGFPKGTVHWTFIGLFVLHLANAVRFYHGNIRHLDSLLGDDSGRAESGSYIRAGSRVLAADFSIILLEVILFGVLALLITRPTAWLVTFSALLVVDVLWIVIFHRERYNLKKINWQFRWLLNNVAHLVAGSVFLAILYFCHQSVNQDWVRWCLIAIGYSNTFFDLVLSRAFYFGGIEGRHSWAPRDRVKRRVFLAAPLSVHIDSKTGEFDVSARKKIELIESTLVSRGHDVYLAHRHEEWGKKARIPEEGYQEDVNHASSCDLFLVIVDGNRSDGAFMELGIASILGKPIIIILFDGAEPSFMPTGLMRTRGEDVQAVTVSGGDIGQLQMALGRHRC